MEFEGIKPVIFISDAVDQYMMVSFIDKKVHYANFLFLAKLVWKELCFKSFFSMKQLKVSVYQDENGFYIKKPKDFSRILSVSVEDECGIYPLLHSKSVSTEIITIPKKACTTCGSDLCSIINTNVVLSTEVINGVTYKLRKTFQSLSSGEMKVFQEYPVYDEKQGKVIINTREDHSCLLDVSDCGCPKSTTSNIEAIHLCGCDCAGFLIDCNPCAAPMLKNKYGYFNHTIESERIYLKSAELKTLPSMLILAYQHNGEGDADEMCIPDYALITLFSGIAYYKILFRDNKTGLQSMKDNWLEQRSEIRRFLYPLDATGFRALQGIVPKWG